MSCLRSLNAIGEQTKQAVVAVAILLLAGCSIAGTSAPPHRVTVQASPATSPAVQPSPVTGLLDPAPTHCPSSISHLSTMTTSADFGGGFPAQSVLEGVSPVWENGLAPASTINPYPDGPTPTPWPGTKVLWVVGPNYTNPVTLQGRDLLSGVPIWFDVYTNGSTQDSLTTLVTLDPAHPNRGSTRNTTGLWNIWDIGLVFTRAGCYDLEASWVGGQWQVVLAVGR
jgi:hypothetical protein